MLLSISGANVVKSCGTEIHGVISVFLHPLFGVVESGIAFWREFDCSTVAVHSLAVEQLAFLVSHGSANAHFRGDICAQQVGFRYQVVQIVPVIVRDSGVLVGVVLQEDGSVVLYVGEVEVQTFAGHERIPRCVLDIGDGLKGNTAAVKSDGLYGHAGSADVLHSHGPAVFSVLIVGAPVSESGHVGVGIHDPVSAYDPTDGRRCEGQQRDYGCTGIYPVQDSLNHDSSFLFLLRLVCVVLSSLRRGKEPKRKPSACKADAPMEVGR